MDTNPDRPAYVYLLRAGDAIKIGVAVNIGARVLALQVGNPLPIEIVGRREFANSLDACIAERSLHERFEDRHALGEWFWIPAHEAVVALDHYDPIPRRTEGPMRPAAQLAAFEISYDDIFGHAD